MIRQTHVSKQEELVHRWNEGVRSTKVNHCAFNRPNSHVQVGVMCRETFTTVAWISYIPDMNLIKKVDLKYCHISFTPTFVTLSQTCQALGGGGNDFLWQCLFLSLSSVAPHDSVSGLLLHFPLVFNSFSTHQEFIPSASTCYNSCQQPALVGLGVSYTSGSHSELAAIGICLLFWYFCNKGSEHPFKKELFKKAYFCKAKTISDLNVLDEKLLFKLDPSWVVRIRNPGWH